MSSQASFIYSSKKTIIYVSEGRVAMKKIFIILKAAICLRRSFDIAKIIKTAHRVQLYI